MQISVDSPGAQTLIFGIIFFILLALSCRAKSDEKLFSFSLTNQLKGFAILAVVLAHIGFFLSRDTAFLLPFSAFAGVGVDLFLVLSGYGLTISHFGKKISPWVFYNKRIVKMFVPLWIVLLILVVADKLFLGLNYPLGTLLQNFFGFFPRADLFRDLDSPLWFITIITFYYLIFPWLFWKKLPAVSAVLYFGAGYLLTEYAPLPVDHGVLWLQRLHILAFPVGVFIGAVFHHFRLTDRSLLSFFFKRSLPLPSQPDHNETPIALSSMNIATKNKLFFLTLTILSLALLSLAYYFGLHSAVGQGQWPEQNKSVLIVITVIAAFMFLPFEFRFFSLLGLYSFEIYLLHWPILYRYDFLYKFLPAGLATILYLFTFLGLAYVLRMAINIISRSKTAGNR